MLKEPFPEELNVQNNMNNSISPQTIPQGTVFDTNQPITSGTYSQSESIQPESAPMKFNVHRTQESTFDMNANNDNVYGSSLDSNFNNINDYNSNNNMVNNYNSNNYMAYGIGDYKKHAASDIEWKRLVAVEVITSLLASVIPILSIIIVLLLSTKNTQTATSITSILTLINSFVIVGLTAVILKNFLNVKRHKNEGMFSGFGKLFPLWVTQLLVGLMIIGSFIIPTIPIIIYNINQSVKLFTILIILALICMIALDIWIILRYSLAQYLVVDGKSPIEALRTSKKLMSGHKMQLFGLVLSFIGWYLVFYLFNNILYVIFMMPMTGQFNILSLVPGFCLMILVTYILVLPLNIYYNMTKVEFYEDRVNNGLNELRVVKKGKPILMTLIISLVLTAISTGLMFLPGTKTDLQSIMDQFIPLMQAYDTDFNSDLINTDTDITIYNDTNNTGNTTGDGTVNNPF